MPAQRTQERVKGDRVTFERGMQVHMLGIDGTWTRDCMLNDISETGAKLTLTGPVDETAIGEFFLLLSLQGLVYRRCELAWVDGDAVGVNFVLRGDRRKATVARGSDA